MTHLVAVHLFDALTGTPLLRGRRHAGTLATWDGKRLRVPKGVSRSVAGRVVEIGPLHEGQLPADLLWTVDETFHKHTFASLHPENEVPKAYPTKRRARQLLEGVVLDPETREFEALYRTRFVFLHSMGVPVATSPQTIQEQHPDGSMRTLTLYPTLDGGWIPHRLIIHAPRPVTPTPEMLWMLAVKEVPCRLDYFQDVQFERVDHPHLDIFALRCRRILRREQPLRSPIRA